MSKFGDTVSGRASGKVVSVQGASGTHTFDEEEKVAFVDWINDVLKDDADIGNRLPISEEGDALFTSVNDGLLLCKLINDAVPDTIDERVLNKKNLNLYRKHENQTLCINSAKAIGCSTVNIGPQDLIDGTKHLVLGLIWQIVKIGLLSKINLTVHPELYRLLEGDETLEDLLKLPAEQLLLRWVNYQLKQAGSNKRIKNFTGDIKDSEAYTILLKQIAPASKGVNDSPLGESDMLKRAGLMLNEADKLDCKKFVRPRDVVNGVPKLNLAFVANLFNHYPALEPVEDDIVIDIEETREEKQFRNWMNSLGVDPFVGSVPLYEDLRDGYILIQLFDKVKPGIVNWKRVNKPPYNKLRANMQKLENCNYCVELAKQMKFSVVGIQGADILDANKKLVLAIVWQLMRAHILHILSSLSEDGSKIEDAQIIEWVNQTLSEAGKSSSIKSFKDKSLSDSLTVCDLVDAIRSGSVNYDLLVKGASSDADLEANAKYAVSIARKVGAVIFALPEDIIEVQPKMMMTIFASLMAVALGTHKQK